MKRTFEQVKKLREDRLARFLITGATGFLGSHTAVAMLQRGYRVVLFCRPDRTGSAAARVERMLNWFNIDMNHYRDRITVIGGDLSRRDLGIDTRTRKSLQSGVDEIIHCAASTSFSAKNRAELKTANVGILENILSIFGPRDSKISTFHHISTIYVCGKTGSVFEEVPAGGGRFYNPYEETKFEGEQYVSSRFPAAGIHVNIYRPAIVYGHSLTGRSSLFNAVYYPVKMALFLKNTYLKDIRERGGIRAAEMGVTESPDHSVHLPIRIEKREGGEINLIPVDFYTAAFVELMENAAEPGIFHIISNSPSSMEEITCFFSRSFNVTGLRAVSSDDMAGTPKNALEIIFDDYLEIYGPYIRDVRRFGNRVAGQILRTKKINCPRFDLNVFSRCMDYAVSVNWKKPW